MTKKRLYKMVLQADDIINDREPQEYDISIDFGDFVNPSRENIINLLSTAITSGVLNIKEAQDMYFNDDKDKEAKELSYVRTLVERGIALTDAQLELYNKLEVEEIKE